MSYIHKSTVHTPLMAGDYESSQSEGLSMHYNDSDDAAVPVYERRVSSDRQADYIINKRELSIDGTQIQSLNEAGMFSSYVNLTNSIIGSGVLGLPYAFAASGWGLGYVLIFLAACCTIFSLNLLTICATKVKPPSSFYSITEATIPKFTFLVDLSVATMCFGVCVSYLIVIGGLMPDVFDNFGGSGIWLHREIWVILGFCVVAPISCFKTLDALKWTSAMAIVFVAFIAGLVFTYSVDEDLPPCDDDGHPNDDTACVGDTKNFLLNLDTVRVLGVFIFAYSCQMNIFPVVNELKNPTIKRINGVVYLSIATALSLYAIVAGAGYSTYGSEVESNILINYPNTTTTSIARIFVSLLVAFSYPLLCNPGRNSMMSLWTSFLNRNKEQKPDRHSISLTLEELQAEDESDQFKFAVTTAVYLFGSFGVAMILNDLGVVLALIGATGSTVITFILPGAAYYTMHKDDERAPKWKLYGAMGLFCLGCVIMPVCCIFIFI